MHVHDRRHVAARPIHFRMDENFLRWKQAVLYAGRNVTVGRHFDNLRGCGIPHAGFGRSARADEQIIRIGDAHAEMTGVAGGEPQDPEDPARIGQALTQIHHGARLERTHRVRPSHGGMGEPAVRRR